MNELISSNIYLRALEPEDIHFLHEIENDTTIWEVSETQTPYAKHVLKKYIENAHQDIYTAKQLRMVIVNKETLLPVGLIDLFNFSPQNNRAGIGIVICSTHRRKHYASQALQLILKYAKHFLNLHQLTAEIFQKNSYSQKLFENIGFQKIGVKKDWIKFNQQYQDVALYQCILKN